jgi:hypothetical protein
MCELEVAAIAEHKHLPDIAAALAAYLLKQAGGAEARVVNLIPHAWCRRAQYARA